MTTSDFAELYPSLINMALYHGATKEESEDIVQELFVRLQIIENIEGSLDRISYKGKPNMGYLFNAIRNRFLSMRKKGKRIQEDAETPDRIVNPVSDTEIDVYSKLIDISKNSQTGTYHHDLFKIFALERHSFRSCAKATGISVSTIFYEITNIKKELKKHLNDEQPNKNVATRTG